MKGFFFFKSVRVPGGSPELGKENPGWVPSKTAAEMVLAGLGMQVGMRTGRVIGKNSAIRGRSMI